MLAQFTQLCSRPACEVKDSSAEPEQRLHIWVVDLWSTGWIWGEDNCYHKENEIHLRRTVIHDPPTARCSVQAHRSAGSHYCCASGGNEVQFVQFNTKAANYFTLTYTLIQNARMFCQFIFCCNMFYCILKSVHNLHIIVCDCILFAIHNKLTNRVQRRHPAIHPSINEKKFCKH